MLHFHRLASLGAEVEGLDLRAPLDPAELEQLRAGLLAHQVLFFRDQPIGPAEHLALARAFGEPVPHPAYPHVDGFPEINILENTADKPPKIDTWHTDMTFLQEPPLGSILRCTVVPPVGGDTMWASLFGAWESLSGRMQRYLDGLTANHSFAHGFRHSLAEPGGWERLGEAVRRSPPVGHPIVRTHPESGRKALFVNRLFTTHINGLKESESDAVLSFLFDHLETPEHTCRFTWRPGSIAFWDNRATLHRPVNDFWPAHRRMERITIAGDRPR
ncbi:MAG: TauD/TfdA family dioxygenase [Nannocystis sp.]|nr:TauD/TfdA family dioxygenase [Nannocystis sp.]